MGHGIALGFVTAGVVVAVLSALGAVAAGRDHCTCAWHER